MLEDCTKVAQVLRMMARVNNHLVMVVETDARHQSDKNDRHESLVSRRRIAQAERPLGHFEEAVVCNELRILDVGVRDSRLMIRNLEVKKRERALSGDGVKFFIEAGKWEAVELGCCVDSTVVYAHAP